MPALADRASRGHRWSPVGGGASPWAGPRRIAPRVRPLAWPIVLAWRLRPGARRSALIRRRDPAFDGAFGHGVPCLPGRPGSWPQAAVAQPRADKLASSPAAPVWTLTRLAAGWFSSGSDIGYRQGARFPEPCRRAVDRWPGGSPWSPPGLGPTCPFSGVVTARDVRQAQRPCRVVRVRPAPGGRLAIGAVVVCTQVQRGVARGNIGAWSGAGAARVNGLKMQ